MTSRISLGKLIKEEFKHHIVSIFAVVLVFLSEILFFYFKIQRILQDAGTELYYSESVAKAAEPTFWAMIPAVILAAFLAIEYFSYLHSQKKTDFYMSLPVRRKEQFWMGTIVCVLVFLIPCVLAFGCECIVMYATGYGTSLCLQNMIWRLFCKILAFLACFMTMALAMILTGHLVIAVLGFGAFCSYSPLILKWLGPIYEGVFFDTYAGINYQSETWEYFSPISIVYGLTQDYDSWTIGRHWDYFIACLVFIAVIGFIIQILYVKRPAEAAGRAMAFPKMNFAVRFLTVIPLALYCGYFISAVSPDSTFWWIVVGTVIGTVLLHGIMESIFRFDMRGMLAKKKQLGISVLICMAFIMVFGLDIMKYDEFVPEEEAVESVTIMPGYNGIYFYNDIYADKKEGIYGETMKDVVDLAELLVVQNDQILDKINTANTDLDDMYDKIGYITVTYQMKNGSIKARKYYMNLADERVHDLVNKICATEEFKDDFYSLYGVESESIDKLIFDDTITVEAMLFTDEEQKEFIETYLQELTELSFTEMNEVDKVARFQIEYKESANTGFSSKESFDIYKNFEETIAFLEKHGIEVNGPLSDCEILSLEVYSEYISETEGEKPGYIVTDAKLLEEIKSELVMGELYYTGYVSGIEDARYGTVEVLVNGRRNAYDVYIRENVEKVVEASAEYNAVE